MIEDTQVSKATDLTYGLGLLVAIVIAHMTSNTLAYGFMGGLIFGYTVHVGSQMAEFSARFSNGSS